MHHRGERRDRRGHGTGQSIRSKEILTKKGYYPHGLHGIWNGHVLPAG